MPLGLFDSCSKASTIRILDSWREGVDIVLSEVESSTHSVQCCFIALSHTSKTFTRLSHHCVTGVKGLRHTCLTPSGPALCSLWILGECIRLVFKAPN